MSQIPLKNRLVAHRGDSDHYPENSLEGFKAALEAGAKFVETDIQITKDNVAILSHDASLKKITGLDKLVSECTFNDIKDLSAAYTDKFADRYQHHKLATLKQLCELISQYPDTQCFVEIKDHCVASHGDNALTIILSAIQSIKNQVILISFNYHILEVAKKTCSLPLGWVWPADKVADIIKEDKKHVAMCFKLNPDYVFCDKDVLPHDKSQFWQGDWIKTIYTIAIMDEFLKYQSMGFSVFETNNITGHIVEVGAM